MFKHAYVRGIQSALINAGAASFPDGDTATKVADYIAARVDIDPIQGVTKEAALKISNEIIEASDYLKKQPNFKAASFAKCASWEDVQKLAEHNAVELMQKAAEGSTIEGGDKGNKEPNSAEGKMEAAYRPEGYAEHSVGKTEIDTKPGAVGSEKDNPNAPSNSPGGSNSITEQRTASITDIFRKAAEGSTILGGDKGNKEPYSAEGKMEAAQRPAGYASLPHQGAPGAINALVSGAAVVGKEIPHPNGPSNSPEGSNSLTAHSAKAAAEDPFLALFKQTAQKVASHIPARLPEDVKVAHVRACMGMTADEQSRYLAKLAMEFGESKSEDKKDDDDGDDDKKKSLPPWLMGKKEESKSEDKKDDDKKDDEKKEAAYRSHVERIAASLRG
jgi:hypothetical protein